MLLILLALMINPAFSDLTLNSPQGFFQINPSGKIELTPTEQTRSNEHTQSHSHWKLQDSFSPDETAVALDLCSYGRNLYAVGFIGDQARQNWRWVVRQSQNSGKTWKTIDEFSVPGFIRASADSCTVLKNGKLVVSGFVTDGNLNSRFIVRQKNKKAWVTLTNQAEPEFWLQFHLTSNPRGDLFIAGSYVKDAQNFSDIHWVIKKSSDHGATWQLVSDYQLFPGLNSLGFGITSDITGQLFSVGMASDALGQHHWITLKSADGGDSWSPVDHYFDSTHKSSYGLGIQAHGIGVIYAVGGYYDSSGLEHWVVRKSQDDGLTWMTVDDQESLLSSYAMDVDFAPNGSVVVTGSEGSAWVTRVSHDYAMSWEESDRYLPPTRSGGATPRACVITSKGDYLVSGGSQSVFNPDTAEASTWITRRHKHH